jgi:hypothetical protein
MKEIRGFSSEEKSRQNLSTSFLEDFIIPKKLLNANTLINKLKNKKFTWENEGINVKII